MMIKELLCGCRTREDVKKMVAEDWRKAEYAGVGKKEFIAFEFAIDDDFISLPLLPI